MTNTTGEFKHIQWTSNYGWICPACHRIYAPTITECYNCNKVDTIVTGGVQDGKH